MTMLCIHCADFSEDDAVAAATVCIHVVKQILSLHSLSPEYMSTHHGNHITRELGRKLNSCFMEYLFP